MQVRLKLEYTAITATLDDNATARDFASLPPLTLTLTDHAEAKKISDLPRRLSTGGAPAGSDPAVGDIIYYAPWGNLALFHQDYGHARGRRIKLGRIDAGVGSRLAAQPVDLWVYPEAWPWPPARPPLPQRPWIVPIPGTTKRHRLEENPGAVPVELTGGALAEIKVEGERYPAHLLAATGR